MDHKFRVPIIRNNGKLWSRIENNRNCSILPGIVSSVTPSKSCKTLLHNFPGNLSGNYSRTSPAVPPDYLQELWEFSPEFLHGFPGNSPPAVPQESLEYIFMNFSESSSYKSDAFFPYKAQAFRIKQCLPDCIISSIFMRDPPGFC